MITFLRLIRYPYLNIPAKVETIPLFCMSYRAVIEEQRTCGNRLHVRMERGYADVGFFCEV
jgi:hypothetical protein